MALLATPTVCATALEPAALFLAVTRTLAPGLLRTLVVLRRFCTNTMVQKCCRWEVGKMLQKRPAKLPGYNTSSGFKVRFYDFVKGVFIDWRQEATHRGGELLVDGPVLWGQRLTQNRSGVRLIDSSWTFYSVFCQLEGKRDSPSPRLPAPPCTPPAVPLPASCTSPSGWGWVCATSCQSPPCAPSGWSGSTRR